MTEINQSNRLELFYMMNVALYLENKYDAFRFIQINKKCEQTLTALKNTPFPFDLISTEWFSQHFNPVHFSSCSFWNSDIISYSVLDL